MKTYIIHTKKNGKLQHAIVRADELRPVTYFDAVVDGETVLRIGGSQVVAVTEASSEEWAVSRIQKWKRGPASWAAIAAWTGRMLREI